MPCDFLLTALKGFRQISKETPRLEHIILTEFGADFTSGRWLAKG
jgi:hypothetical protein